MFQTVKESSLLSTRRMIRCKVDSAKAIAVWCLLTERITHTFETGAENQRLNQSSSHICIYIQGLRALCDGQFKSKAFLIPKHGLIWSYSVPVFKLSYDQVTSCHTICSQIPQREFNTNSLSPLQRQICGGKGWKTRERKRERIRERKREEAKKEGVWEKYKWKGRQKTKLEGRSRRGQGRKRKKERKNKRKKERRGKEQRWSGRNINERKQKRKNKREKEWWGH